MRTASSTGSSSARGGCAGVAAAGPTSAPCAGGVAGASDKKLVVAQLFAQAGLREALSGGRCGSRAACEGVDGSSSRGPAACVRAGSQAPHGLGPSAHGAGLGTCTRHRGGRHAPREWTTGRGAWRDASSHPRRPGACASRGGTGACTSVSSGNQTMCPCRRPIRASLETAHAIGACARLIWRRGAARRPRVPSSRHNLYCRTGRQSVELT